MKHPIDEIVSPTSDPITHPLLLKSNIYVQNHEIGTLVGQWETD